MRIPLYQLDAFADQPFSGNPAAVMPLPAWLPESILQAIAAENNLSETAFLVREAAGWRIRWFTPACEVDLCGHATLASAWVVVHVLEPGAGRVGFQSTSGPLAVERAGDEFVLDFPSRPGRPAPELLDTLTAVLGVRPDEALFARDAVAVLRDEATLRALRPDFRAMQSVPGFGVLATAPAAGGRDHFVSRCFFPNEGVPEDPVTGSAHCTLIPYWAARLAVTRLSAFQASARGGRLSCELVGDRVRIGGRVTPVLSGIFELPDTLLA